MPRSYQRPVGGEEIDEREESPTLVRKVEVADSVEKKVKDEEVDCSSDSDDAFETLDILADRAAERRTQALPRAAVVQERPVAVQQNDAKKKANFSWMANDTTQPMKLTDLYSIPRLPYKQNWMVNVLAVVAWLSDIEPTYLPPGNQRRAGLVDPTTEKEVLLTVLLDPESFTPQVGSVVLLAGVKNHQAEGGSLRKYMSDKPKGKKSWWVENPEQSLEWCQAEAAALREWQDGRM
ncbi:hypothetical protein B0T16DRAFT_422348 [Cercophora newfieldiana]|uniref:Uncharacterized protein n=1 Tax=Cercophora newfieldiana TaxID=92897 RepID=A0AA40CI17_9PEZI|nr:hypothetical protein B0T16DRAFT_422348 [Cercophora newfieldiana]